MQFIKYACVAALVLATGSAYAELLPLAADSAVLDRSYIPALMLSNGKDAAKAVAAHQSYEKAWTEFAAKQRKASPGDAKWNKVLVDAETANAEARAALAAGRMSDAHNAQEVVRHALWRQRQQLNIAYQPDLLTDFHATMEVLIATAQGNTAEVVDRDHVAALTALLSKARTQWIRVKAADWNPADYRVDGARLESYRAALVAEEQALEALDATIREGNGARIGKAAAAIKPPFAKAYAAFGVFPQ